jgi:autotransporter-associated beta strand protein
MNLSCNNTSGTQIWNGLITDAGGVWRNAAGGTTVLNNTNTYTGVTRLTTGTLGVGCDSISILAPPAVDAGPMGAGTFTVDTTTGTMELIALGGARVVGNSINFENTNSGSPFIIGGSNNLTLSGTLDLTSSNRVIQTDNTGLTILSGVISDSGAANGLTNGLTKTGAGVLYLDAANEYVGDTTNSAGLLAGSGSVAGRLLVQSGATLGAGDAGILPGTFTINSDLLLGGNGWFRLSKNSTQSPSNDLVEVVGSLLNTGSGAITVTNVGPALVIGDTFTLFSEAVSNGAALTVSGGGMNWTNRLALDGSIQALSVFNPTANYSTNLTYSFSGGTLTIGWPATHLGWILQSQTNALTTGLATASNAWTDVAGTGSGTNSLITDNRTNPAVFFRLRHP